jgi:hypothetical protein
MGRKGLAFITISERPFFIIIIWGPGPLRKRPTGSTCASEIKQQLVACALRVATWKNTKNPASSESKLELGIPSH